MKYYVNNNAQPRSGDHEVHQENCGWLKRAVSTTYLGEFTNCHGAVIEAKRRGYSTANGCKFCAEACHTG